MIKGGDSTVVHLDWVHSTANNRAMNDFLCVISEDLVCECMANVLRETDKSTQQFIRL